MTEHDIPLPQFLSLIAHEFRTPLAVILSSSEILRHYSDRLPPEKRDHNFDLIKSEINRLTTMMDDVLLLSRLAAGQVEMQSVVVEVNPFCRELTTRLTDNGHDVRFTAAQPAAGSIETDPDFLQTVLGRLLDNAIKFSPSGTPVHLVARRAENGLCFEVRDSGIGIPPDEQAGVYEPFKQGSNIGRISGSGLGLSIARQYLALMGGSISLQSVENEGTTVVVIMPDTTTQL